MKQVCILLALVGIPRFTFAQHSLQGKVMGVENEPLAGAYVMVNNTYYQTITDNNGYYLFKSLKPGSYTLKVSYMGYEPWTTAVEIKKDENLDVHLQESAVVSDAVVVSAVRASRQTPTTFTVLNKETISRKNMVQDMPYLLTSEPSVVTTSDAGAGVGYTGLRIRGSDITRINVTINGIPLNDPESHAVYWVDIPDFASSVNSLQLQRGVGSSTNGAGAFGASMNLETNTIQTKPFGEISMGAGSFNTWKTSFQAGTGLINNHWYFEGRASALGSDGYIDRASSALSSYFIQGGYYDSNTLIKVLTFGGREKTYQAWYGVDDYTIETYGRKFNWAGVIYDDDGTLRYYDDQTDNYQQDHYQIHIAQQLSKSLSLNLAGHYTMGRGYYQEYMQDEALADYGLNNLYFGRDSILDGSEYRYYYHDTITSTDLIRRRWLDNHYYGLTWSLNFHRNKTDLVLGGAFNAYKNARHYGEIIWAEYSPQAENDYTYYDNMAQKSDFNLFAKISWSPVDAITLYGDLQYRTIAYQVDGTESHLNTVTIDDTFHFLNPKAGISYNSNAGTLYASYSMAHREPIRDDYLDANEGEKPNPETLGNLEVGIRRSETGFGYAFNYYLMHYLNQLVLTGEINDDGAYIRRNTGKSYRTGVEMSAGFKPVSLIELAGNLSLSINKTDYHQLNDAGLMVSYENTDLSFSPSVVGGMQVSLYPVKNLEINWQMKYVGKQYLDNTSDKNLMLDNYLINDALIAYLVTGGNLPETEITFQINNVLNTEYASNGYAYGTTPYYYPQAGVHFMIGLNVKF